MDARFGGAAQCWLTFNACRWGELGPHTMPHTMPHSTQRAVSGRCKSNRLYSGDVQYLFARLMPTRLCRHLFAHTLISHCACGWMSPPIPRSRSENPIATEPPKDRPRRSISFAEGLHPDADRPYSWDAERTPLLSPDGKPRHRERLTALIKGTGKATFPQKGGFEDDTSSRGRTFLGGIFCGLIVALVISSAAFTQPVRPGPVIHPPNIPIRPPSYLIHAEHGAVASENESCSIIGVEMLKQGGSAVDAAIAATLCIGVTNMFSSGIGGGGFMVIKPPNETAYTIDFRETAPSASNATMFLKDPLSSLWGGLAVAVPGEIRGLAEAHRRWGKLPWRSVFEPSVKLSTHFRVTKMLAERLQVSVGPKYSFGGLIACRLPVCL